MQTLLEIRKLSFSYNNQPVITDISFSIDRGSTWAIIGKNGAGKSTLVKCIGGLVRVAKGCVSLNGKDLHSYSPKELARVIAYCPQASSRNHPPFSVFDYVLMGRFPYQGFMAVPSEQDRKIVKESLELTDTLQFSERLMSTLSGGELQRVFLAGAVAQRTEMLLLDEPVTFLDPLHQELVYKALARIHEEFGPAILTVTHDINAALTRFSHVLALIDGEVFFCGTSIDFLEKCPIALEQVFSLHFEEARAANGRRIIIPGMLL